MLTSSNGLSRLISIHEQTAVCVSNVNLVFFNLPRNSKWKHFVLPMIPEKLFPIRLHKDSVLGLHTGRTDEQELSHESKSIGLAQRSVRCCSAVKSQNVLILLMPIDVESFLGLRLLIIMIQLFHILSTNIVGFAHVMGELIEIVIKHQVTCS